MSITIGPRRPRPRSDNDLSCVSITAVSLLLHCIFDSGKQDPNYDIKSTHHLYKRHLLLVRVSTPSCTQRHPQAVKIWVRVCSDWLAVTSQGKLYWKHHMVSFGHVHEKIWKEKIIATCALISVMLSLIVTVRVVGGDARRTFVCQFHHKNICWIHFTPTNNAKTDQQLCWGTGELIWISWDFFFQFLPF